MDADDLLDAWRSFLLDQDHRPATVDNYCRVARLWLDHLQRLGAPWQEAGPGELRSFLDSPPVHEASAHRRRGPALSQASRRQYAKVIRQLYGWAVDEELLDRDPFRRVRRPREPDPTPRALDVGEVAAVLAQVAGDARLQVAVMLGYGCGLRVGEIAAARVEDLRLGGHRPTMLVHGKGGKDRLVPVPDQVAEVLQAYLAGPPRRTRGPLLEAYRSTWGDRRVPTGRHLDAKYLGQKLREAMVAAGVAGTAHSLRHTYATELVEATEGAGLMAVSRALGHSSTKVTEKYYVNGASLDAARIAALLPDPRGNGHTPDLTNTARVAFEQAAARNGATQRAIAGAVGVDQKTVSNDLRREENSSARTDNKAADQPKQQPTGASIEESSSGEQQPEPVSSNHGRYLPPEVAAWVATLDQHAPGLLDQIRACLADLERLVPQVERAMAQIHPLTRAAEEAFYSNHPDGWSMAADEEWNQIADQVGISRLWALADRLLHAHPDY